MWFHTERNSIARYICRVNRRDNGPTARATEIIAPVILGNSRHEEDRAQKALKLSHLSFRDLRSHGNSIDHETQLFANLHGIRIRFILIDEKTRRVKLPLLNNGSYRGRTLIRLTAEPIIEVNKTAMTHRSPTLD